MIDSKQNPEVNPDGEGEIITLSIEEHKKLVEANANLTQDKVNLVNEIKELREKKQLTDSEKAELAQKLETLESSRKTGNPVEADEVKTVAEQVVSQILSKKEAENREMTLKIAREKFLQENPQFSEENDEGGIKKAAFDRKLAMFNIDKLKTESEFLSVFNDVNRLLGSSKPEDERENNIPPSTDGAGKPKTVDIHELSSKEIKVINQFLDGDKEKYIKMKAKRPDYIASLLQHIY